MTTKEKQDLLTLMTETHSTTRSMLEEVDFDLRVYGETGWRVRDIIGHIATWDLESAKSTLAYAKGGDYAIPDLVETEEEDGFNELEVKRQGKLSVEEVLKEWEDAHEKFKTAVSKVSADKLSGDMLFPWGSERGSVAQLVKYMCDHDIEHREEIKKAISGE